MKLVKGVFSKKKVCVYNSISAGRRRNQDGDSIFFKRLGEDSNKTQFDDMTKKGVFLGKSDFGCRTCSNAATMSVCHSSSFGMHKQFE